MSSDALPGLARPYEGEELPLFAKAVNWKNYWASFVRPYLRGSVLEVGAGSGNNTQLLCHSALTRWVCLEPDPALAEELKQKPIEFPADWSVLETTTQSMVGQFDVVLYLDVLEHIEKDREEISDAVRLLNSGGHLVVLSPAHSWLYSDFDKSVGHFRRYSRQTLSHCVLRDSLRQVELRYLDSVGLAANLTNRLFLKKSSPSQGNIRLWDTWMVPVSRLTDPVFSRIAGRSVLGIWAKD